jgi:hypothetical protein
MIESLHKIYNFFLSLLKTQRENHFHQKLTTKTVKLTTSPKFWIQIHLKSFQILRVYTPLKIQFPFPHLFSCSTISWPIALIANLWLLPSISFIYCCHLLHSHSSRPITIALLSANTIWNMCKVNILHALAESLSWRFEKLSCVD